MTIRIYHHPRCSKSRQALKLIEESGISPEIIRYLDSPPDREQLRTLLEQLGMKPRDLLRSSETAYRELGLANPALSDEQLIAAIAAHPRLLQRPIVVKGERAVIGRPLDNVAELLEDD